MKAAKTEIESRLNVFKKAKEEIERALDALRNVKDILSSNEKYILPD
jgi:hypothetical protein